ncbi:MAG: BTAD domain-containing putative transcriptional regulator [Gemmatimonadaceae bacterium]
MRLRTFGAVYIERDDTPLGGAHSQRRRLALLAYLAATEKAPIAREKLIALLWPESDESSGRHSLSQLLYALRHDLGADAIAVDSETVRLNPDVIGSDVHAFDRALRDGRVEEAVAQYRGAFLEDFRVDDAPELDRWIEEERARRAFACARALDRLADAAEKSRDWHRAVDWLRRRVTLDPGDSRSTLRLMQALSAIGDRDGAVNVARVYQALLLDEPEAEPDPSVAQLAGELRRVTPAPAVSRVTTTASTSVPGSAVTSGVTSDVATASASAPASVSPSSSPRRLLFAAVAVVAVAAILMSLPGSGPAHESVIGGAPGATVVIGDLEGPDSVLALAVREALRAELVNTKGVLLTSDVGIRELKTLMRLPRDAALRPPQLLSLATRSGAHVAVAGSVVPVGAGAQIVLELLDPGSGRSIQMFAERPINGAATLAAVGRLSRLIGAAVSRTPRDSSVRPLPAVTTASLAALKSYALARKTAALGHRRDAVAPAERALAHDSAFVLAHYFLGDLLWFVDEQTQSEAHLTRAYELRSSVPAREQLVIRARYEQLARDRPDSALAYWQLLHETSPGDVLAYEGRTWALRALGRHEEAAASADTAMSLDPGAILPNVINALYSWLSVGDTASALAVARRVAPRYPDALIEAQFYTALYRDPTAALAWADSTSVVAARHWRRHLSLVAQGNVPRARAALDSVLADSSVQYPPNALLNQGLLELALGDQRAAARYARAALDWTRPRDLSPPAVGRLGERIGDLAARAGDEATVRATIALVQNRDRGRSLRTYVMAQRTLDAALAYVRGDFAVAARQAEAARHGVYFSRSLATIVQLEAHAWRAAGERAIADSLARLVATHQIVDGHFESWLILRAVARLRAGS